MEEQPLLQFVARTRAFVPLDDNILLCRDCQVGGAGGGREGGVQQPTHLILHINQCKLAVSPFRWEDDKIHVEADSLSLFSDPPVIKDRSNRVSGLSFRSIK